MSFPIGPLPRAGACPASLVHSLSHRPCFERIMSLRPTFPIGGTGQRVSILAPAEKRSRSADPCEVVWEGCCCTNRVESRVNTTELMDSPYHEDTRRKRVVSTTGLSIRTPGHESHCNAHRSCPLRAPRSNAAPSACSKQPILDARIQ